MPFCGNVEMNRFNSRRSIGLLFIFSIIFYLYIVQKRNLLSYSKCVFTSHSPLFTEKNSPPSYSFLNCPQAHWNASLQGFVVELAHNSNCWLAIIHSFVTHDSILIYDGTFGQKAIKNIIMMNRMTASDRVVK